MNSTTITQAIAQLSDCRTQLQIAPMLSHDEQTALIYRAAAAAESIARDVIAQSLYCIAYQHEQHDEHAAHRAEMLIAAALAGAWERNHG